ncbi:MAG: CvpA family protein [Candidatus Zhuqueibacterota bacterium]
MIKAAIAIIDLLIIFVMVFFIYKGYKNGFTTEFMRALGTIVAFVVAVRYMSNVAIVLYGALEISPTLITIFSFIVIFTLVLLGFKYLTTKLNSAIKFSLTLGNADRVVGIVMGLIKGSLVVSLCTVLISFMSFSGSIAKELRESQLYNPMRQVLPLAYSVAKLAFSSNYKSFSTELEETFSGQTDGRKGEATQSVLDYYRTH